MNSLFKNKIKQFKIKLFFNDNIISIHIGLKILGIILDIFFATFLILI